MNTILTVLFFAVAATSMTVALELPSNWKTCRQDSPKFSECVGNAAKEAVASLAGGLKSFKILPLEPLAVDSIKIGDSDGGSISLKQEYRNIKLYGLTKGLQISNYNLDWDKKVMTSDTLSPQVDFVADYKIEGKVLLLPIKGSGRSNITMSDMKSHNTIHFDTYEKKGETYMRVTKYVVKLNPSHVTLQFSNLFEGDNVLGEQMNRFINENSDLLFKEMQGPYEETFGLVFAQVSNAIFSRVPINKIFPKS